MGTGVLHWYTLSLPVPAGSGGQSPLLAVQRDLTKSKTSISYGSMAGDRIHAIRTKQVEPTAGWTTNIRIYDSAAGLDNQLVWQFDSVADGVGAGYERWDYSVIKTDILAQARTDFLYVAGHSFSTGDTNPRNILIEIAVTMESGGI